MAEAATLVYIAPIIIGIAIGLVELFFVHADESGMGWMSHGLHAIPTCILFTMISMNVPAVIGYLNVAWLQGSIATYGIPAIIGIIAAVKVKSAAAIAKGGTIGESLPHALIIGALIAVAPFIYPLVAGALPLWAQK
jgi:hypothetical protein